MFTSPPFCWVVLSSSIHFTAETLRQKDSELLQKLARQVRGNNSRGVTATCLYSNILLKTFTVCLIRIWAGYGFRTLHEGFNAPKRRHMLLPSLYCSQLTGERPAGTRMGGQPSWMAGHSQEGMLRACFM